MSRKIKCVVWDLDQTMWDGVLLESDESEIKLRPGVVDIIKTLDERGILQSIASKNEFEHAYNKLKEFGIEQYFLYPQISWNDKSDSIKTIAKQLNIGIDTFAFVDDQSYELEEVKFHIPEVLGIPASEVDTLLARNEFIPDMITEDTSKRRQMYIDDMNRNKLEEDFTGTKEEFLASLNMKFTIKEAEMEDLQRVEELTKRTHQLNTTGYTYSFEELCEFANSPDYKLLVTELEDKLGNFGKIGVALIHCTEEGWTIKLLLMSCRVMSRGVGSVLINYIINWAKESKVDLFAEFLSTDRNRMMYITYKLAGFKEVDKKDNITVLKNSLDQQNGYPDYIKIEIQ